MTADLASLASLHAAHVTALAARYAEVLARHGYDALLVHSGLPRKRTEFDDQYWPLRPTPFFEHWLALKEADCLLVVTPGGGSGKPRLVRRRVTDFWERPGVAESEGHLGAFDLRIADQYAPLKGEVPAGLLGTPGKRVAFVGDAKEVAAAMGIPAGEVNPPQLLVDLDALRTLKSPYEVACLAEANRRAALGHKAVLARFLAEDISELELHLTFLSATAQDDPETPYKNIVALGENAAVLHHVSYGRAGKAGPRSLLLDAGATAQGYCSDITRTAVKGHGEAADTFRGLLAGVEKFQQLLCDRARPGVPYESLHDESHRLLAELLVDARVVRGSAEEAVATGITRAFYPHGLGHSLGLQCHDVGCALVKPKKENPFLRNTSVVAEGQAFTVEPGVYFLDALLDPLRTSPAGKAVDFARVDALMPFGGIRIEDDLVVGPKGEPPRNLTRAVLGGSPA